MYSTQWENLAHLYFIFIADIVCQEISLLKSVRYLLFYASDPSAFASDFSSGFLLGELLFKFGLQNDFEQFSQNKYVTQ